uniref:TSA: Wollemia nobilis Ref_Wollemi_Transcript_12322_1162 transcribed RNA sequence n=1 Tax=Wollemia nobilis TaxID=56998 RepID=A0A0C9S863_9CONI
MASFHFMRKVVRSAIVPAAIRTLMQQRAIHSAATVFAVRIRCSAEITKRTPWIQSARAAFASKSEVEENLIQVVDSEIQCALESDQPHADVVPDGTMPFTIEDKPGEQIILLTRKYGDEDIKVEVMMLGMDEEDDEEDEDKGDEPRLNLTVTISKGENNPVLEFNCDAYTDEITIGGMTVKDSKSGEDRIAYEGPDFSDLDENLQKSFHKYLEVRGIKPSLSNFLNEYMINKDNNEYIRWLKNVKEFLEK